MAPVRIRSVALLVWHHQLVGIRSWHAVLAPLDVTVGVRRLSPEGEWRLPSHAPLLAETPGGEDERNWRPIGEVLAVVADHGYLMAFGVVVGAVDGPVQAMIDGRRRPEFDIDDADLQYVDDADGDVEALIQGGTINRIYAGELPAWAEARFTVGGELARPAGMPLPGSGAAL